MHMIPVYSGSLLGQNLFVHLCMCVCVFVYLHMCVYVCARARMHTCICGHIRRAQNTNYTDTQVQVTLSSDTALYLFRILNFPNIS